MSNQAKPSPTTPTSQTAKPSMTTGHGNHSGVPHERIAQRAYDKWCKRGCPQGTQQQDWLEAEAELRAEMSGQSGQMAQPMHQSTGARPAQTTTSVPQKTAQRR